MNTFSKKFIDSAQFHPSTTWLLTQCSEARGMQEMWNKVRPETLKRLKESAIIQSTESSNRIEGVEVEKSRLVPLVIGKSKPRDRSEEEVQGYRRALNYIHNNYNTIKITPTVIKKLHKLAQGGMISDAGRWKAKDNDIIEILPSGERNIRFIPVSANKTPKAIEQLCLGYIDTVNNNRLPDLICVSNFVLDFLCIHPFRDGNGRVARLLTLLLLYQNGYEVGKYISIEKLIEESKDDYYDSLKKSSKGWHEYEFNLMPWWNYILSIIKSAYQDLKERVEFSIGDNKSSIIRETILSLDNKFSISDILRLHPTINRELIKKVLLKLKNENLIEGIGKGRGAMWKVKNED
jgi:Fic family protein